MEDMEELLRGLHTKLAEKMEKAITSDEVTPATLTAIAKFLKDNGIVHVPKSLDALQEAAEKYESMGDKLDEADPVHLEFPKRKQV